MSDAGLIQVGLNEATRVVKMRVPDAGSPGGFLVVRMSVAAARELAEQIAELADGAPIRLSDGRHWVEHKLPAAARDKIAGDLRRCADLAEALTPPS